uniref:Uncharacterized protein n=1 Tax=Avena sativa TaxID=4498 RepID=A0ACD5WVT7_AVESA
MFVEISYLKKCTVVVLLILPVFATRCLSAIDNIVLNESIADGQNLVSVNNHSVLGFFSPGASSNRYIGIWYNTVPNGTAVRVANRNNPVQDKSGILKFDNGGNLILLDGKGSSFTVASGVGVADVEAVILDSGNFVLRSMTNHSNIVWQSFASPTDTWLSGMDITVGNLLTSWRSNDDPAMGDYTFGPGIANASQFIIWWNGNRFWTGARWTGDTNSLIPDLKSIGIIPVSFQCDNLTCMYTPNPSDRMTKIVLDRTGSLNLTQFDPDAKSWTLLWRQPESCDMCLIYVEFMVYAITIGYQYQYQHQDLYPFVNVQKALHNETHQMIGKGALETPHCSAMVVGFTDMPRMRLPDSDNGQKLSIVEESRCESVRVLHGPGLAV